MALIFISKEHANLYAESLKKANAENGNKSLQAALYVLTSLPNVKDYLNKIVNFPGGYLDPERMNSVLLSSGEQTMVALAVNLYNGTEMFGSSSPYQSMVSVDQDLKRVYISALAFRFIKEAA